MNRAQRRRARAAQPAPDRHPADGTRVHDLNSLQLKSRLVRDAVSGNATPLEWFVAACQRIAHLDGITLDAAYLRVRQEVASLGGVMPDAPGS